jgi:hypothetical protein
LRDGGVRLAPDATTFPFQTNINIKGFQNMLSLRESYHRLVDIGEQADKLCHRYPDHRCAMHLRDLATHVSIAILSLPKPTLETIKRG